MSCQSMGEVINTDDANFFSAISFIHSFSSIEMDNQINFYTLPQHKPSAPSQKNEFESMVLSGF